MLKKSKNERGFETECISSEVPYCGRLRLCNPHKIRTWTIFVEYVCYKMVYGYHVSLS